MERRWSDATEQARLRGLEEQRIRVRSAMDRIDRPATAAEIGEYAGVATNVTVQRLRELARRREVHQLTDGTYRWALGADLIPPRTSLPRHLRAPSTIPTDPGV